MAPEAAYPTFLIAHRRQCMLYWLSRFELKACIILTFLKASKIHVILSKRLLWVICLRRASIAINQSIKGYWYSVYATLLFVWSIILCTETCINSPARQAFAMREALIWLGDRRDAVHWDIRVHFAFSLVTNRMRTMAYYVFCCVMLAVLICSASKGELYIGPRLNALIRVNTRYFSALWKYRVTGILYS